MSSLNKAMIIGRLGQDPEVRYTQSNTAVSNLSVATSESYTNKEGEKVENTEWHRVVCWGRLAEICQEYLQKGSQVYIEGPLQTKEWETKEGETRYTTEIKGINMTMLGGKGEVSSSPGSSNATDPAGNVDMKDDFEEDDLPF